MLAFFEFVYVLGTLLLAACGPAAFSVVVDRRYARRMEHVPLGLATFVGVVVGICAVAWTAIDTDLLLRSGFLRKTRTEGRCVSTNFGIVPGFYPQARICAKLDFQVDLILHNSGPVGFWRIFVSG